MPVLYYCEDDELVSEIAISLLGECFQEGGFSVGIVLLSTPEEAMAAFQKVAPDYALIDGSGWREVIAVAASSCPTAILSGSSEELAF